jgi:hypothetical protein
MILGALLLICSAMAAQAFTSPPSSSMGRLFTLGGGDAFNSNFWADSEEVTNYPGSLTNYGDIATISFSPAAPGAMGVTLSKTEQTYGTYYIGLLGGATDNLGNEINNTTLGYGYSFESFNFGFMFNRQAFSNTNGAGAESSNSWNTFTIGSDFEVNEDTNADVSLMYQTVGDETSSFGLNGRAFYGWKEDVVVIPVVHFSSSEGPVDFKTTMIGLGLGFAYTVNESNDVVFGLNWQSSTMKNDTAAAVGGVAANTETSMMTMPGFYVGTQHEFTDWLEVRAGATKSWNKTDPDGDSEMSDYPFAFALGAGVAIGDWQVDLGLTTSWLYNVGYWFHGAAAAAAPVASIQAKLFF